MSPRRSLTMKVLPSRMLMLSLLMLCLSLSALCSQPSTREPSAALQRIASAGA
jgi:hypothetical protein